MPMYDYRCTSCGNEFTKKRTVDERRQPTTAPCPECGEMKVDLSVGTPLVSYSTNPGMTTTSSFNDRMKEIGKTKGKGCTIDTRGVS